MRLIALALSVAVAAQADPQPLPRVAAAERAWAAAAAEQGWRDSSLAFVAPDGITLRVTASGQAQGASARDALEALPLVKLPLALREIWEPVTGQVSEDGTLAWMIGPRTALNLPTRSLANQGAFFHVWRLQPGGQWRFWLDEDVRFPDVWQVMAPFQAAAGPDEGSVGTPEESLAEAERDVSRGGDAWRARLVAGVRVHRAGRPPMVGRAAVLAWAEGAWAAARFQDVASIPAGSNDLGVACGAYTVTGDGTAERGTWARVWQRDIGGRWRIVFETSQARSRS
jgi:hypothetical protein